MAAVYILFSEMLNRFYIGSCNDLQQRLQQHKEKFFNGAYTSRADDWELFLEISELSPTQARTAERYIKSRKSTAFIRSLKMLSRESLMSKLKISAGGPDGGPVPSSKG